ncbi:MAG: aspartate/glutamate racemase family protein [Anaerolineae bacterium]|jgi:Asp/Glu/hydantoin racemase|nr:aspartate/glutamate racemase family protein [Anaerolineae bacterium]
MKKLAIIHTTTVTVEPLKALAKELLPQTTVINFVDDSILPQLRKNGSDIHAIAPRWIAYAHFAEEAGADIILNACSSVGELCTLAQPHIAVPIVRIDAPMAELAVCRSDTIGVVATVPMTLGPTVRLLQEKAIAAGRQVTLSPLLIAEAFERLSAGDSAGHDTLLVEALTQLLEEVEVIVLAQASMARITATFPVTQRERFLSSPRLGMEAVRTLLEQRMPQQGS